MHLLAQDVTWDPFPLLRRHDEMRHRRDARRAIGVSATGLAITGLAELAVAVLTGSVALLGDAFHNLSDLSTSLVVHRIRTLGRNRLS